MGQRPQPEGTWLPRDPTAGPASIRLLCLPYAGGGVWIFRRWQQLAGDRIRVCPLHLPGHDERRREPAFRRAHDLIAALSDAIAAGLTAPFAVFGHSMGALLAFEFARELQRRRRPLPMHVFLSGYPAPTAASSPGGVPLHLLPDDAFLREIEERYGSPRIAAVDEEMLRAMLPTLRADVELYETYRFRPAPPLSCPLTVFAGDRDRSTRTELEAWQAHTTGTCRVSRFPGDHFYLHRCETALVHEIRRALDPGAPAP